MSKTAAIIAAAGKSSRTGGKDKLFEMLNGIPVIVHTIIAMCKSSMIDSVVIVTREEHIELISMFCREHRICKPYMVVAGGTTRAESVLKGISALTDKYGDMCEYIAIHDGARPFAGTALIDSVVSEAVKSGAAIPAVKVTDTIKKAINGFVSDTPPRDELYAAQTPQVFNLRLYLSAVHESSEEITDDSLLFERAGIPVKIVDGDYKNIKITTSDDFILAEALCKTGEYGENMICSE